MPISFLNPGLLLGALAAAVPIVLHLLNRRRVREIRFSDLRFLEEVQVQRSRSLGLHRLLLLLLRVLAILLIALAVARPRLSGLAPGDAGRVSMLVVVDASASMQTAEDEGPRFAAAVAYAATTAADLTGGSEIQVLLAADEPRAVFGDWTRGGEGAAGALRQLTPTDGGFDLPAALTSAA
ncbi:BatA and WFA domain-containing protein, partial [bacterium]|nr:BatA and WFA domain-containing protein [bacterium]